MQGGVAEPIVFIGIEKHRSPSGLGNMSDIGASIPKCKELWAHASKQAEPTFVLLGGAPRAPDEVAAQELGVECWFNDLFCSRVA